MPRTQTTEVAGLSKQISKEPFPLKPQLNKTDWTKSKDPLYKWIEELEIYIRRIAGKFTAINIANTIIQEGSGTVGLGFVKSWTNYWHYYGTNNDVLVTLDSTKDWFPYIFSTALVTAGTLADLKDAAVGGLPARSAKYTWGAQGYTGNTTIDVVTRDANLLDVSVETDATTGALQLRFKNDYGGVHKEYYAMTHVIALCKIDILAPFTSVGNGL